MATEIKGVPMDFVYAGKREGRDGKAYDEIWIVHEGAKLGRKWMFKAERATRLIGAIYTGARFDDAAGMAYGLKDARWTGKRWSDAVDVTRWQLAHDDDEALMARKRIEANEDRSSMIEQALRPIREVMDAARKRGDYATVHGMQDAVIRALHKPVMAKEKSE